MGIITKFIVVFWVIMGLIACGGILNDHASNSAAGSSMSTDISSSSAPVEPDSNNSTSSSSSSLAIGECPPGFNSFPEVAVMDIELGIDSGTFTWSDFGLPIIMPRLEVAQQQNQKTRSKWAISFSLFPKAHACSLPDITLVSYVQSFRVQAIKGDTSVNLTPFMAAINTSESGNLISGDDAGVSYPLNEWNGLSKETNLGQAYFGHVIESIEGTDTELTLSFESKPPITAEPVMLEVEATFNDGTVLKRTTGLVILN